ncbi:MAG TPA: ABC transporter permease [Puia sp.]|nr:ABC transporter permease [Puia sp.]
MFSNYFKTAFRNLWRNKVFSLINIIGLSVGLSCCMLIFLYAKDELSFDRFHEKADRIYHLTADIKTPDRNIIKSSATGMMPGPNFTAQVPEIESFVRMGRENFITRHGAGVFDEEVLYADSNFFSVFTFPMLEGNPKTALKDMYSVVLSEEVAKKYFGKQKALGKLLEVKVMDTFRTFLVTGVTKTSPQNSSIKIKMMVPMRLLQMLNVDDQWFSFYLNTFFVLKPGVKPTTVQAKMAGVFDVDAKDQLKELQDKYGYKNKVSFGLQPLLQLHTSTDYPANNGLSNASNPMYSYILTGIALFIMLIACINFINLTVARSLKRAKEIGIRKVVGGLRHQLIAQFLGESFILSFIAFIFAMLLVILVLPFFNTAANKALAFNYLLDAKLVAGYITIFFVTALLAGFYPAMVLSGFNPVQALYNRQKFARKNYLSKGLVVLQFTLATFLIIATVTIYEQFNYLMHYDIGYNDKNVVVVNGDFISNDRLAGFKAELFKNPLIKEVTADQGRSWHTKAHVNNTQEIGFDEWHIDGDYLRLFEIKMVKGRNFSKNLASDKAQGALVNESFVKKAGWQNPLGQVVDFYHDNLKYTVIGVVKDYNFASLTQKIDAQFFAMTPDYGYGNVFIKLEDGRFADVLTYIEKTYKRLFPLSPYQYTFKDAANAEQYNSEAKWKQIISFGALLTVFISCIGLFGLATLSAEKRKKEIGIRKVLGASVQAIATKLSNDFLQLVIIAALIASPAAWWAMSKWLENYPYRIAISVWIFFFATIAVLFIALVTVSFQSIKAAVANPVKSLRME